MSLIPRGRFRFCDVIGGRPEGGIVGIEFESKAEVEPGGDVLPPIEPGPFARADMGNELEAMV